MTWNVELNLASSCVDVTRYQEALFGYAVDVKSTTAIGNTDPSPSTEIGTSSRRSMEPGLLATHAGVKDTEFIRISDVRSLIVLLISSPDSLALM